MSCINVPLVEDVEEEGAETFTLVLSTSNQVPVLFSEATGMIIDNDFSGRLHNQHI